MHPFEVTFDGLTLRGWRRPGQGPRCLAVHGWLDNANTFLPLTEYLTDWEIISVDLPGHGRSDHLPHPGWYHFIDTVHWVVRLIQHWQPEWLLGHSLGGGLISMAAAVQPVQGAILLDALGPITSPAEEAPQIFRRSLQAQEKPFRRRYYASYQEALARLSHPQLAERSLQNDANGYFFAYDPRVKYVSRLRMTEAQIQAYLREVKSPVQVQSYSRGILPPFGPLQERLACLAKVQLVEIEGGHHHHLDDPAQVAEHILAFQKENHG
ncbi:alpha/beta hydrolase [bacterium]|nr:alpha/beta hydrolase [bacterium]